MIILSFWLTSVPQVVLDRDHFADIVSSGILQTKNKIFYEGKQ